MKITKLKELTVPYQSILLYGASGAGKTTAMSLLKGKTLLIDVDRGSSVLKNIDRDDFDVLRLDSELTDLPKIIDSLEKKNEYTNIIIDTLSELEKAMLTVLGRLGKNSGCPELSHYNQVNFKLIDYCRRFRALNSNVVFLCWEKQREHIDMQGTKYTQSYPLLADKIADTAIGLVDVVGRLEVSIKDETKGKRYVRLESTPTVMAKDRINKRTYCEIDELIK